MIVTAGAIDCHVHFICPQLVYEAISSGKFHNWKQFKFSLHVFSKYLVHALVCWIHGGYADKKFGRCLRSFGCAYYPIFLCIENSVFI